VIRVIEVAALFFKLGAISFGGPAAHIALMEQEVVVKRGWLSREHFLDLLAATNLVPGPNATEMAIHIGFVHAGWPGLVAGGVAFIVPAFLISLALAIVYVRFGTLPQGAALFYGVNPAVMAIILTATYRLGRTAIRDKAAVALGVACLGAVMLGVNEVMVLLTAGVTGILIYASPRWPWLAAIVFGFAPPTFALAHGLDDKLARLGLFFLKVGALIFGSGMVLFAFIQRDVVTGYGWLSQKQLVDAIAVGQMTPGPVLSSATFIGYLVAGLPGAIVSTLAIFLPSFAIMSVVGPWIPRLRTMPVVQACLKGVNAAVVAAILSIVITLAHAAVVDGWTAGMALIALLLLVRYRVETWQLVLGGAAIGVVHNYLLV